MSTDKHKLFFSVYRRGNGKGRGRGRSGRNHPSKRLTRDGDDSDAISGTYMPCCMQPALTAFQLTHLMTARYVLSSSSSSVAAVQQKFPHQRKLLHVACHPVSSFLACFLIHYVAVFLWIPGLIIGATSYCFKHRGGGKKGVALQRMMTMVHLEHKAGLPGPPGHQQGLLHRALTQVRSSPHEQWQCKCPCVCAACEFPMRGSVCNLVYDVVQHSVQWGMFLLRRFSSLDVRFTMGQLSITSYVFATRFTPSRGD